MATENDRAKLRPFARWAIWHSCRFPRRGVFARSEEKLYQAVDRVATTYLGRGDARKALGAALTAVEPYTKRDEIEVAVNDLSAVLDVAYFNAGLAFGVTFADPRVIR